MMTADKESNPFDEYYFQHGCGRPYERDEEWLNFFGSIADRIVNDFQPRTVLDAGCAKGFLVEALKERGVDAYGLDISDYAIGEVHENIKDFCWVGSVTDPLPMEYDLIVCIEVLEHMEKTAAEAAIVNLCTSSEDILFSSTPFDYKEATHFNVQPPEYWAELFAKQGFFRDMDFDASFITAWAVRFLKREKIVLSRVVREYERGFYPLWKQNTDLRSLVSEMRQESAENQLSIDVLNQEIKRNLEKFELLEKNIDLEKDQKIADLLTEIDEAEKRLSNELKKHKWDLSEKIDEIEQQNATIEKLQTHVSELTSLQVQLSGLNNALVSSETQLQECERRSKKIENNLGVQLTEMRLELEKRANEIQYWHNRWGELESSIGWWLLHQFRMFRFWIAPEDSKRESLYLSFIQKCRSLLIGVPTNANPQFEEIDSTLTREYYDPSKADLHLLKCVPQQTSIRAIEPLGDIKQHSANVDIIVCVHNALDSVKDCLSSIVEKTFPPYQLILVDDGSSQETTDYLKSYEHSQGAILLRNEKALGYTLASNQALRVSKGDYVVLINSDTVVTNGWLDRLIECAKSDKLIGMVGPLSNTASWQSIPMLFNDSGDWAENNLPDGVTIDEMGDRIARQSGRVYPRISFLNGFCILLKRDVIDQIGYFDEETFGEGYGEENDYSIRLLKNNWKIAIADDVYIFHAQSKSYSNARRAELTNRSNATLAEKHGQVVINEGVDVCRNDRLMQGVRARSLILSNRNDVINRGLSKWEGKRILFLLPIMEPGGGGHVIVQEARAMRKMGVDARIINLTKFRTAFERNHPNNDIPVEYIDNLMEVGILARKVDAVVATVYHTVSWLKQIPRELKNIVKAYYIQDFEPFFFKPGSDDYYEAIESYNLIPDLVQITKTDWTRDIVAINTGHSPHVVGPSVDIDLFRPRRRLDTIFSPGRIRVSAMIRPSTPRRNANLTVQVLKDLHNIFNDEIEIGLFGCPTDDPKFLELNPSPEWKYFGVLPREQLASFVNEIDVFVDLSKYQAMGLSALEAMASGAIVIAPEAGGADSFLINRENGFFVDTTDQIKCLDILVEVIRNDELRTRIMQQSIIASTEFYPELAAYKFLSSIFSSLGKSAY